MKVRFKKLSSSLYNGMEPMIPVKAHDTDAGFDLMAVSREYVEDVEIPYNRYSYVEYDTGIVLEIPEGYVGLVFPRSSISKKSLSLCNSVGVIDSGYRGTIKLRFRVNKDFIADSKYHVGDLVGQLVIIPIPQVELVQSDELSDSDRGTGGFGSTGR